MVVWKSVCSPYGRNPPGHNHSNYLHQVSQQVVQQFLKFPNTILATHNEHFFIAPSVEASCAESVLDGTNRMCYALCTRGVPTYQMP